MFISGRKMDHMDNKFALSVKQVNMYVKSLLDSDRNLSSVVVQGEISNFTLHSRSGHMYFTLKDEQAAVKAVMFKMSAMRLSFMPRDGQTVIVHGRISLYERDGQYQLYADAMVPAGLGQAYLSFLALKEKLEKTGMFSAEHKKTLPKYPEKIGLATSPTGAAVHDVSSILARRWPQAKILLYPCLVQGEGSVESLKEAISYFNSGSGVDVIILARGGGSYEDLSAFNDESLASAVYESEIPIVSGVGHESDVTIIDFVADCRGATPSAAAELVSPDVSEVSAFLKTLSSRIGFSVSSVLRNEESCLNDFRRRLSFVPHLERQGFRLNQLSDTVYSLFQSYTDRKISELSGIITRIEAYNPLSVIGRGYGLVRKGEKSVRTVRDVLPGDKIDITLQDGEIICAAKEIKQRNHL